MDGAGIAAAFRAHDQRGFARIVDGSESVRFLVRVKELLEDLSQLMLEG